MVRFEVLAVGRELLIGRTLNTNAHWFGRRLALLGTMINEITTVDDDLDEIATGLRACLGRRPDVLVVVGGLGPTPDDMTLRGIARGLGKRLRLNRAALELVREHYAMRGMRQIEITTARKKMATLPTGAEPLRNEVGTAPGARIDVGRTTVFCLPGVPSEMRNICARFVIPEVRRRLGKLYRRAVRMKMEGILESALAPIIATELKRHPGMYIKSHPRGAREGRSRIELDVVSVKGSKSEAERVCTSVAKEMAEAVVAAGAKIESATGFGQEGA
ncbi:MAG: hypothetical protein LYZ66_05180 [Nitrososphaerales archaeon]|nr:hypothetical protein [Nitrososphaerales archaeon]